MRGWAKGWAEGIGQVSLFLLSLTLSLLALSLQCPMQLVC